MAPVAVIVRAAAVRWVRDDFPGWIEVSVSDAGNRRHGIVEKVPVLTSLAITAESAFPFELWFRGEMVSIDGDDVSVMLGEGMETLAGARTLVVATRDVVRL